MALALGTEMADRAEGAKRRGIGKACLKIAGVGWTGQ